MSAHRTYELENIKQQLTNNRQFLKCWLVILPRINERMEIFQKWMEKRVGQKLNKRAEMALKEAFKDFDALKLPAGHFLDMELRTLVKFELKYFLSNYCSISVDCNLIYSVSGRIGCSYDKALWFSDGEKVGETISQELVDLVVNMRSCIASRLDHVQTLLDNYDKHTEDLLEKAVSYLDAAEAWQKEASIFNQARYFIPNSSSVKLVD